MFANQFFEIAAWMDYAVKLIENSGIISSQKKCKTLLSSTGFLLRYDLNFSLS
jgi:hypothetical protein